MITRFVAALALASASPLFAQAAVTAPDFSYASPLAGTWAYVPAADGSQAVFRDAAGRPQLTIQCTRSQRRVMILKPASAAAAAISVWTSSGSRSIPTSFQPATAQLTARLSAYDPFLDSIAFSRGRIAASVSGGPALVMPAWAETTRVIEDCRS